MTIPVSRRTFLQAGAAGSGSLMAARTVLLAPQALASGPVSPSDRVRFGMIGIGMQGSACCRTPSRFPAWSASLQLISTMAATRWPKRSPAIRTCRPRAATRNCSTARTSTASWRRCPITGISEWWWMPATRARTSIAKSRCRTPRGKALTWWSGGEEQGASCRSARSASVPCCARRPANVSRAAPSARWKWWSSAWAATIPPARGSIRRRWIFRRRISIGKPG